VGPAIAALYFPSRRPTDIVGGVLNGLPGRGPRFDRKNAQGPLHYGRIGVGVSEWVRLLLDGGRVHFSRPIELVPPHRRQL